MNNALRNKYSLYNAITSIGLTLTNGFLGIVVVHYVMIYFGSDFNGINSTANQIINALLVLEGGFTVASCVALFKPITTNNIEVINSVLAATKNKFKKIAFLFFVFGTIVALVYSFFVKSELNNTFIFTVIFLAVIPQVFNLFYVTTYRVLLQAQQKEYIINAITMLTIGAGHLTNIVLITHNGQMWMVRFVTTIFSLLNGITIIYIAKKSCSSIDLAVKPEPELIKGTNDIMVAKITGVLYNSFPIIFLSISAVGGSKLASVYAVYNSVFIMIKSLLHGVIDAPRLGFGQMISERKRENIWNTFKQYEYIVIIAEFVILTTTCTLILPFISVYTDGVNDINYYDTLIAILMIIITGVELIHIPSGNLLNMAGEFKVSKNIQIVACSVLAVLILVFGNLWGIYGMLLSLLITAILLAVLEIGYIHIRYFEKKIFEFLALMLPYAVFGLIVNFIEKKFISPINGYFSLCIFGAFLFILHSILGVFISLIFNRKIFIDVINRFNSMIFNKKRA